MFKQLAIGFAVLIPLIYMIMFHIGILLSIVLAIGVLLIAYAIGDILLTEYWRRK